MSAISYVDVFQLEHDEGETPESIAVGDLVRTGPNHHPHFAVIAINGDKAWVRNVQSGQDALAPLNRCRKVSPDSA
jgi:hypothetical protein